MLYGGVGAGLEMLSRQLARADMSQTLLNGACELLATSALNPFHHFFYTTVGSNSEENALQGHCEAAEEIQMLTSSSGSQRNSGDQTVFYKGLQLGQNVPISQLLES